MKRLFICSTLLFLMVTGAFSQAIHLGIGIAASNMSIAYNDEPAPDSSYPIFFPDFSIFIEQKLDSKFSLKPGLWINWQGRKLSNSTPSGFYIEHKYEISYIDFPLLFTYNFKGWKKGGYRYNINIGPYIGYAIKGKDTEYNGAFISEENLFVGTADVSRMDAGILFTAGIGFSYHQVNLIISRGLRSLAIDGGRFDEFQTFLIGVNYNYIIDFEDGKIKGIFNNLLW